MIEFCCSIAFDGFSVCKVLQETVCRERYIELLLVTVALETPGIHRSRMIDIRVNYKAYSSGSADPVGGVLSLFDCICSEKRDEINPLRW